jgi:hypothetical protein
MTRTYGPRHPALRKTIFPARAGSLIDRRIIDRRASVRHAPTIFHDA